MSQILHQRLTGAEALDAWEPLDGHAILTCKIKICHIERIHSQSSCHPHNGAYDAWEPRTYGFLRVQDGWIIDTNPGYLKRESWQRVVSWFCRMEPVEIELLTTV